jgi:electron transfer flavoprotein beta subunit
LPRETLAAGVAATTSSYEGACRDAHVNQGGVAVNIAVAVRLMPNLGDELEVDPGGADIDREFVDMVINEFDDQALEEAVLIKQATGATVTVVGLQAEGIEQALRVAFARGADRVVVVDTGEIDPYDSRTAALAFAEAFRQLAPDLVLIGVQTPQDVFGQTAPYLAVDLGWPQANVVASVTLVDGAARVVQEYAGGRQAVMDLELPAIVGVQSASSPPRYVSMSRLRQAMSEATTETLEVSVEAATGAPRLVSLARPEPTIGATMLEGDAGEVAAQIVAVLRERGVLAS